MEQLEDVLMADQPKLKQYAMSYVEQHPHEFETLIQLSFSDKHPYNWRAAWVLAELVGKHKVFLERIGAFSSKIVAQLREFPSSGQQREYLKVLTLLDLSEEDMGILLDLCFSWLMDKKVDIAIRVQSMQMIYDYSLKEPDLQTELKAIILEEMEYGSAGFRNRGGKILDKIEKRSKKTKLRKLDNRDSEGVIWSV